MASVDSGTGMTRSYICGICLLSTAAALMLGFLQGAERAARCLRLVGVQVTCLGLVGGLLLLLAQPFQQGLCQVRPALLSHLQRQGCGLLCKAARHGAMQLKPGIATKSLGIDTKHAQRATCMSLALGLNLTLIVSNANRKPASCSNL